MSADPKTNLIAQIEKNVDLFQGTIGKANSNVVSTITMILNGMGQTILAQFDEIQKLNTEISNLKSMEKSTDTTD
jgi:hypothetical protein